MIVIWICERCGAKFAAYKDEPHLRYGVTPNRENMHNNKHLCYGKLIQLRHDE